MENQSKPWLMRVQEQLAQKMTRAIVAAIEDGAKIEANTMGVTVDGVFLVKYDKNVKPSVVLSLDAPEIDELFEPSRDDLIKMIQKLQNKINQINIKLKRV